MAKERRGWKAYIPSLQRVGQIFVALVAIKVVMGMVKPSLPANVQPYVPSM